MKMMTTKNLQDAFAGESQAHMKYMIFADQAEREGLANIARLFRAASYSEQMHATAHLRALGGVNATPKNLEGALGGENFEIAEMYRLTSLPPKSSKRKARSPRWNARWRQKRFTRSCTRAPKNPPRRKKTSI